MDDKFVNLLYEMESLQTEMQLGLVNMNAIMETMDQWTEEHKTVVELLHCPYVYIFDAVKQMEELLSRAFEIWKEKEE